MVDSDGTAHGAATPTETPGGGSGLIRSIVHRLAGEPSELPVEGRLAAFKGATAWLNAEPLTPEGLRGRVVLVDFWTYTCVNWLRTLPYVRAWAAKYADHGLTVVGVHTPEFAFERDVDNVTDRTAGLGIAYPVAVDSDYGVWRAFNNHYWPAAYVADGDGRIRYHHFGEGEYEMTEMVIQQLLFDAGAADVPRRPRDARAAGPRGRRRLAEPGVPRDLSRLRPGEGLRVSADHRPR
jgi:thiol-disulfide isomerase/thioredoxin